MKTLKHTWIYLIKDNFTGFYKIGESRDPIQRLRTLRREPTLLPVELDFKFIEAWFATGLDEKRLHKEFYQYRRRGEWFALENSHLNRIADYFQDCKRFSTGASDIQCLPESDYAGYIDLMVEGFGCEF